eukprot:UN03073
MMETQLKEIGYDARRLPLGKIKKSQITRGYKLLQQISDEMERNRPRDSVLTDLTDLFYTLIPHQVGFQRLPVINNQELLDKKIKLVEVLQDVEIASRLLDGSGSKGVNPFDHHYDTLKTKLTYMPPESKGAKMIKKYVELTHCPTHTDYTLTVQDCFEVGRHGSSDRP